MSDFFLFITIQTASPGVPDTCYQVTPVAHFKWLSITSPVAALIAVPERTHPTFQISHHDNSVRHATVPAASVHRCIRRHNRVAHLYPSSHTPMFVNEKWELMSNVGWNLVQSTPFCYSVPIPAMASGSASSVLHHKQEQLAIM